MGKYLVEYYASIFVEADSEAEALDLGISEWEREPNGSWDVREWETTEEAN